MTREELLAGLKAQAELFRAEGVRHVALFGSQARGDARPDSDIDLFVEYEPGRDATIFDVIRLEQTLTQRFGRDVQLLRAPIQRHRLKADVELDAIAIF